MKNARLNLLILLLIGFSTLANAQKAPSKTFAFVLGSWEMQTPKGKLVEQWVQNPDKTLSGKSYRINAKGDSTLTETLQIKNIGKDTFYCSTVNGQNEGKEVSFKLISTTDQTYVFENKTHDFPQRIVYQNKGKKEMLAWIEGELNGKSRKSEFKYIRK
ncbi:hypothetical protein G7074_09730 [Pedobacter sp. HDW13]|uniref:DUF6265 family protein n=1 Tax=unclassified Pedobacter TaxID=2628915 RepID=UPI000F5A49BC|nr:MULTISPECIES: DUF6265 family protein [unclassified Pedobacter]QIL39530.1 hypothetical protein G7074_09730 [Pedobacter sp. HDW13]RQO78584.1 hypothetical protein DBR40_06480 [Pedobacter sp. KBW01]